MVFISLIQLLVSKEMCQGAPEQFPYRKFSSWTVQQNLKMLNCYSRDISKTKSYNKLALLGTVLVLPTASLILVLPRNKQIRKGHCTLLRWGVEADVRSGSSAMETA